jgi:hypothetical protein
MMFCLTTNRNHGARKKRRKEKNRGDEPILALIHAYVEMSQ